jgi:hypothetical protein
MDRIKSLIALARSRERLGLALQAGSVGLLVAAVLLALLVLVAKLVPGTDVPNAAVIGAAFGGGLVAAIVAAILRRSAVATDAQLALRIDERLRLQERLTSALAFERSTDAYARAAVADAVTVASDPALRAKVRNAFPARVPAHIWATIPIAALLVAAQVYLPAYDWPVEEMTPVEEARLAQKKASEDAIERVKEELESAKALPQDVRDSLASLAQNAESKVGGEAADEDARREAIRRMSELQNRLDDVKKSGEALRYEALKRDLAGLEKQDGPLSKFSDEIAKGDFASAKQELEELAKKIESGEMAAGESEAAAAALEQMAKSLETLADRQQSLKDELERAGLDAQLASNPEALERAIAENPNLSEQQREQLQKGAAAAKASQQALKKLANASQKAADAQKEQQKRQQQQKKDGQQQQQQQKKDGQQQQQKDGQQQQQQQKDGQQQQQQGGTSGECQNPGAGEGEQSESGGSKPGSKSGGESGEQSESSSQDSQGSQSGQQGGEQGSNGQQQAGQSGAAPSADGLSDLAQSLSELEQVQQMLQEAESLSNMAQSESQSLGEGMCKGGNCQAGSQSGMAQGQAGAGNGQRNGMGRAQGGNTGKSRTPSGTRAQKAKTQNAGGDIIARQLIDNPNPEVTDSVMPVESIEQAVDGGSGVAVGEDQVPAHLKEAHKHYFGSLKKEIKRRSEQSGGSSRDPGAGGASGTDSGSSSGSKK